MSSGLELILNASTGTPVGGVNTARVQNDIGDLCLWSSNFAGMRIAAGTGNVSVSGALNVTGQLTASNVSVLGTTEIINAYETHSSNVVINNYGTGPALSVTQTETTAQPVAAFYAGSSNALFVTSAGQVGIGKSTASYALDVSGSVNVSGTITTGNACSLIYWKVTGNMPPNTTSSVNINLPTGILLANIVGFHAGFTYGTSYYFPFSNAYNNTYSPNNQWICAAYINGGSPCTMTIVMGSSAIMALCPFTAIIVTSS